MEYNNNMGQFTQRSLLGKLTVDRLPQAQEADTKELEKTSMRMGSRMAREDLSFRGIVGKFSKLPNGHYRFNMYYASQTVGSGDRYVGLTFRKMECIIDQPTMHTFYTLLPSKMQDIDVSKEGYSDLDISCEVMITGRFSSDSKYPMFRVVDMYGLVTRISFKEYNVKRNNILTMFDYGINAIKAVKNGVKGCGNITEVVNTHYEGKHKVDKAINKGKLNKAANKQLDLLRYMFNKMTYFDALISTDSIKLNDILKDITMMHTSIQCEEFDQLGVLYDNTCLSGMEEVAYLIITLLYVQEDTFVFDAKEYVLLMLIYFKQFYSIYLRKNFDLSPEVKEAYRKYDKELEVMMIDLGFDLNMNDHIFESLEKYINKLTRTF